MRLLAVFGVLTLCSVAVEGLRCWQQITNASYPLTGNATDCQGVAWSCTKEYLTDSMMVRRACSSANCSLNGQRSNDLCVPNGVQINCCCYNDGCNSAPKVFLPSILAISMISSAFFCWPLI